MSRRSGNDNWLSPRPRRGRRKFTRVIPFAAALGGFLVLSYEQQFDVVTRAPIGWLMRQEFRVDTAWGRKLIAADTVVALTASGSWSVPANWNSSNNTIYCIGPGANGAAGVADFYSQSCFCCCG